MKLKLIQITLSLAFALPAMAGKAIPNTSKESCSGRIVYVAEKKNSISVKTQGAEVSTGFKINAETKVTLNGAAATVADLHKDWKVVVTPKAEDVGIAAEVAMAKGGDSAKKKSDSPSADKQNSEPKE